MPSLQGRLIRQLVKQFVGPKFRRAGESITKWRDLHDFIIKNQRIPDGADFRPVTVNGIAAEWIRTPNCEADRAILYLHGGGLIMGSPATHRELAARISAAARIRVLVLDYRLAPEHPFPAGMRDVVTAYRWLLENGYSKEQIVVGGDSAGGGLALQALIALRDEGYSLPAAAFFMSPPVDWVRFDGESLTSRADVDPMITVEMCRFTSTLYVGESDPDTPLFYPLDMDLSGLPPLCIHVGDNEVLLSDSTRLAERARACGVPVELRIWRGMWHAFQSSAALVPEARQSLSEIAQFISDHLD
jgi:acetyl esterase/lipase